ncbi:MAG: MFS transporter [Candidatus Competibacterales bacterium]|nr:MFS transporter [Candidatus Competibacterales bacterium]
MTAPAAPPSPTIGWRTPAVVLVAGCLIAMIGFGIRSVFGLFLEPMTLARDWSHSTFALAMALQNLLWGIGLPFAGGLADRFGPVRVILTGALVYALGVAGMAVSESPLLLQVTGGLLTGLGVAFTAFSLALAAMARVVGPQRRSLALGLGTAAGSLGQVVFSPVSQGFIGAFGWQTALLLLAGFSLLLVPLALVLPNTAAAQAGPGDEQTMAAALREAMSHRGYVLLTLGFFVCGFHVAFITVHFPAYTRDLGLGPEVGAYAIALVGLFNIAGSFLSGALGQRWSKKCGLSAIYGLRAVAIVALLMAPKTAATLYLFSAAMGLLWLSTVPLTTGIVAQVFGIRYMATLFGIVFLSHQIGSFLGVWLGGWIHDLTGSYDPMWWAGAALGLAAMLVHLPIDERPLPRLATSAGPAG